jgi:hypothetical protein
LSEDSLTRYIKVVLIGEIERNTRYSVLIEQEYHSMNRNGGGIQKKVGRVRFLKEQIKG